VRPYSFSLFPRSTKHKEQRSIERKSLYLVSEFQLLCRFIKAGKGARKVKTDCITSRPQDPVCISHLSKSIFFGAALSGFPFNQGHKKSRLYTQTQSGRQPIRHLLRRERRNYETAKPLGLLLATLSRFYQIPDHKSSTALLKPVDFGLRFTVVNISHENWVGYEVSL
jgi:hypothetical protein